jgi:murein DD-endopeptidase MepM/ murein hydrolase activator NlpD
MRIRKSLVAVVVAALACAGTAYAYRDEIRGRTNLLFVPVELVLLYNRAPDATLLMPVDGVQVSEVADTWGTPRPGDRSHQGQDIFASRGTPVRSATDGIVLRKGVGNLGGNYIFVQGAGGRRYYYAHLDSHGDVEIGDRVTTDTILGYVGDTGNAVGLPPHLHFGMYERGAKDPLPLLVDR